MVTSKLKAGGTIGDGDGPVLQLDWFSVIKHSQSDAL